MIDSANVWMVLKVSKYLYTQFDTIIYLSSKKLKSDSIEEHEHVNEICSCVSDTFCILRSMHGYGYNFLKL